MCKTQYSFSTDPKLKGAPSGHTLLVREVRLSSGAEFTGHMWNNNDYAWTSKVPAANSIKLNNKGEIEGLF